MKKLIMIGLFACLGTAGFAQDFKTVLEKNFIAFDTTWDQQQKLEYSNKLGLIAKKFNTEWLATYYAAYSKVQLCYAETNSDKKDALLDEAQVLIDESVSVAGKDNDETYVIKAMIANARIGVNPMSRWQKYGKTYQENVDKAKELNPDNPRMFMLQGITKYYTPAAFGGGKKAAMPYLEKAKGLFEKQVSGDITKPYWGAKTNDYFIGLANGTIKEEAK